MKPDTVRAKEYLVSVFPVAHTPDKICEVLGLSCSHATLGRKLRSFSVGPNPELKRGYYRNEKGRYIAVYGANKCYRPQERPQTTAKAPPPSFYWYTLRQCPIASPMYLTVEAMRKDPMYSEGCRTWKGTHEHPILVDIDTHKG